MNALRKIAGKPKYYFIFPVVVAALFSASFIKVACPVCGGTGSLVQSVGMENVRVVSIESRILSSVQDACTGYIVTRARPIITLTNSGTEKAIGYLNIHLIDLKTGKTLTSQNLAVEAGPNALTVLESIAAFAYNTVETPPADMEIQAEVLLDAVPCIACDGSGNVSVNTFLLTKSYKDKLISTVKSQQQYSKDPWEGSKEWMDWMELS